MKCLVISAIVAMTSLVNVVANNFTGQFAYNTETRENRVETQTVFKVGGGKYLHRHLKYHYTYDKDGRITQKEAQKWNEHTQRFEEYYLLTFLYSDDVTVEFALWNEKDGAYTNLKEKAVYQQDAHTSLRYLSYEWNDEENDWNLTKDYRFAEETANLLAEK